MTDNFDLDRFLVAQEEDFASVLNELKLGKKTGHWIWYVFPQVSGLGHSETSRYYAIPSLAEAEAYLAQPALGRRLVKCTKLVMNVEGKTAEQIFGATDAMKFRSSMTLFAATSDAPAAFQDALDRYFDGVPDPLTLRAIGR